MNHIRKDKNNVRPIIFQIVLDALKGLNMSSPVRELYTLVPTGVKVGA
jgi:hypothetical protein